GNAALVDRNVVHGELVDAVVAAAVLDRSLECLAPLDHVAPGHEGLERGFERVAGSSGQKADPPEVDAEDGNFTGGAEARPAEQRAVSAEGDERVELDPVERGDVARPELTQTWLGVQLDTAVRCPERHVLEHRLEVGIARIADDADLHLGSRLSSCWSAVMRRAMPAAVRPYSSSCSPRGACSIRRSGTPSATTRTSGCVVCSVSATHAPKPFMMVPSSIVTRIRCSWSSDSSMAWSSGLRKRAFTTAQSIPSAARRSAAWRAGCTIVPTARIAMSLPERRRSQVPYGTA